MKNKKNAKHPEAKNLFELSIKEQEKIMKSAVSEANKAQRDLARKYDQQYGEVGADSAC